MFSNTNTAAEFINNESAITIINKYLFTMIKMLLVIMCLCVLQSINAQAPEKIKYQTVIKNNNGDLVSNQNIAIQMNINQSTANGTTMYTERHIVTTSENGLVALEIGGGTTTDDFTAIPWGSNTYFLNVAIDLNNGTNYTDIGTQQLVSVPYTLHSNTSNSSFSLKNDGATVTANSGNVKINSSLFGGGFTFSNNKMLLSSNIPNFGNTLQLEFKDDSNANRISNVFPSVTTLPPPRNGDYELNLIVRGNNTLSARGDGSVRFNDNYTLPTTDGNAGQALLTDGNGILNWSTIIVTPNESYSFPTTDGINNQLIKTDGKGSLSWTTIPYTISRQNTALGPEAGAALRTANRQVLMGYQAGSSISFGLSNVMIGNEAGRGNSGSQNTFIGSQAGKHSNLIFGSSNVFIGKQVGSNKSYNDKLHIDNSSTSTPLIEGYFRIDKLKVNGDQETTGQITTKYLKMGSSLPVSGFHKVDIFKNVGNVNANSSRVENFTINGVSPVSTVFVSPSEDLNSRIVIAQCWVSADNTVSVRFRNTEGGSSRDPDGSDGATYSFAVITPTILLP